MITTQKSQTVNFKISSEHELTIENLKLRSYIHTSNMVMFDHEGKIHKYETLNGIMQRFCKKKKKKKKTKLKKHNYKKKKKRFMEEKKKKKKRRTKTKKKTKKKKEKKNKKK